VSKQINSILNRIRKYRTLSLKIAFPILIGKDIIFRNKPHELDFGRELSMQAGMGAIFVIIGVLIRLWARGHCERGRLFTTGPYALVRHPLYLGSFMIVVGLLCQLNGWLNWAIALPLFGLSHGVAIIYEEISLAKQFGTAWNSYASRVPALIPSFGSLFITGESARWGWRRFLNTHEFSTTFLVLCLPVLIELLEDVVFEEILHV
jgi:hypothetical protein